jgi:hypothetical protein
MFPFAKKLRIPIFILSTMFLAHAHADYAIPGCEDAWNSIDKAKKLKDLQALIVTDCSILYRMGWRLPIDKNKGGTDNPDVCGKAWHSLETADQLEHVKFMVLHNCPVFYRKAWVIPPPR